MVSREGQDKYSWLFNMRVGSNVYILTDGQTGGRLVELMDWLMDGWTYDIWSWMDTWMIFRFSYIYPHISWKTKASQGEICDGQTNGKLVSWISWISWMDIRTIPDIEMISDRWIDRWMIFQFSTYTPHKYFMNKPTKTSQPGMRLLGVGVSVSWIWDEWRFMNG